ncbi:sodium-dependent transporter [Bradyrhizobium sp.]|uniref:sodium-dependent transporter n=1 Tax=Bradyrhizobium sp. TaxID=376 RepID=UPI002733D885|nr:sodium-dependent transporter [Bradyrhizobium sp.]MDP3074921.1 sodium-dependent transporter [Bradyrhizobium sp.]
MNLDRSANSATWSSSHGFLLATIGSAIGLGNIWRFSYLAGENGGGAFILIYALAIAFIGLPVMVAEFALGRAGGADPTSAYPRISRHRVTTAIGWLAVVACCVTLAYYAVVAGWVARYLMVALTSGFASAPAVGHGAAFADFTGHTAWPILWQGLVMVATAAVVAAGVNAGIERLCKVLMPALAVVIVGLALYSLSLPGSGRGLAFMFLPDWPALGRPQVYLAALGQAFFSLGVGYGTMLTYGAYAGAGQSLTRNALLGAVADTLFALVAGVAIFGAVFAFGLNPASGPSLAFITLPEVFDRMPGGTLFAIAFFGLLLAAALTSAVGLLEVPVAALIERTGTSRRRAAWQIAGLIFALGIPTALGFGPLKSITFAGMGLLETYDMIVGEILLPVSVLAVAAFVGWFWAPALSEKASGLSGPVGRAWLGLLRYAVPIVIVALFAASLLKT